MASSETIISVYIGRDNSEILELTQDGVAVKADSVTRAVFAFGDDFCVDTDDVDHADYIELISNKQMVKLTLGKLGDLSSGYYSGKLTIYDEFATEGLAWIPVNVRVSDWPICVT